MVGDINRRFRKNIPAKAVYNIIIEQGFIIYVSGILDTINTRYKPAVTQPGEKRPTRGTEHTLRLARKAGLTVREERWAS